MKFAPFHTLMLSLLICIISCKDSATEANEPNKKQNILPNSEHNFDNKNDLDKKEDPGTLKPTKEQLDRAIEKKKKNSILDSLKPKTA